MAKPYETIFLIIISLCLSTIHLGCESGNEAVDTTGLSQVHLRIEGMT